ncbi:MAG: hypothetical protein U0V70_06330 [Terriglobia bacterium]
MKYRRFRHSLLPMAVLLGGLLCSTIRAGTASRFEMTPEVARILRAGLDRMYNYDVKQADALFDELIQRFPNHTIGYMHKAELIWWLALMDNTNDTLKETFRRYNDQSLLKGEELLAQDPNDFYNQLYLGATYENQTKFYIFISKSYLGALTSGMKGYKYIEAAHALRPEYVDCLIGLGARNYFAGSVPAIFKPFAFLLGSRGNKQEGIQQLLRAATSGEFGQTEAKTVLLGVYLNEKKWKDYQELACALIAQYPANPVLYFWLATAFISQKHWDEGIHQFEAMIGQYRGDEWQSGLGYGLYQKGRLEFEKGDTEAVLQSLNRLLKFDFKDQNLMARALLLRAFANDLLKKRDSALADYRATLALPNVEETHRKARRYMGKPYSGTR